MQGDWSPDVRDVVRYACNANFYYLSKRRAASIVHLSPSMSLNLSNTTHGDVLVSHKADEHKSIILIFLQ